jgi:hypothetical protein
MVDTLKYVDLKSSVLPGRLHETATSTTQLRRLPAGNFTWLKISTRTKYLMVARLLLQVNMVLLLGLSMEVVLPHQVPIIIIPIQLTLGQVLIVLCSPPQYPTKRL